MKDLFKVKESTQEIFDKSMKEIRGYQVLQHNLEDRLNELSINDKELRMVTTRKTMKLFNTSYTGYTIYYTIYKDLIDDFTKKYGKDFELHTIKTNDNIEAINDLIQLYCIMECLIMIGVADILSQYSQAIYHIRITEAIFHNQERALGFIRDIISFNGKIEYKLIQTFARVNELTDFDCDDILNLFDEFVVFDKNDQKLVVEHLIEYKKHLD